MFFSEVVHLAEVFTSKTCLPVFSNLCCGFVVLVRQFAVPLHMAEFVFCLRDGRAEALLIYADRKHIFFFFQKVWAYLEDVCVFVWESENTVRMSALFHLQTKRPYKARKSNSLEIPVIIFCIMQVHMFSTYGYTVYLWAFVLPLPSILIHNNKNLWSICIVRIRKLSGLNELTLSFYLPFTPSFFLFLILSVLLLCLYQSNWLPCGSM